MTNKHRELSTSEFAAAVGVPIPTLYSWCLAEKLNPKKVKRGKLDVRVWSESDLERALALKLRLRRGRPVKSKNAEKEVLTSGRLLQLNNLLGWYAAEFADQSSAAQDLQLGINAKLRDRKW